MFLLHVFEVRTAQASRDKGKLQRIFVAMHIPLIGMPTIFNTKNVGADVSGKKNLIELKGVLRICHMLGHAHSHSPDSTQIFSGNVMRPLLEPQTI